VNGLRLALVIHGDPLQHLPYSGHRLNCGF
jgi:hypothetical protein